MPDHLVGTDDPDLFTATSLDQLQSGDSAFGNGGTRHTAARYLQWPIQTNHYLINLAVE